MTLAPYRVLARKYRPATFDDLIGQEVMVRTLTNGINSGRLAHAFLLTGIRGVGKTTTARIIARALNCIGADGTLTGPTPNPCGVCVHCQSIAEDRHMDVLETDAASRTGVGDMRELIDTVHYLPSSARYKVYIIDEVHMLSGSAFNALLKTLEEPPPHVKFIFATTETRKIPVTILSRCQRFDLKRVESVTLAHYLSKICGKEQIDSDMKALELIASAAEGSVRDALSLLDQAIAHGAQGQGAAEAVSIPVVREMLGLADKTHLFDMLENVLMGKTPEVLTDFQKLYANGADPVLLLQELLELVHFITRIRVAPAMEHNVAFSEVERERGKQVAANVSMTVLTRTWQMLLKGLTEARLSSHPDMATEMVLVRIAHAADLPSPAELIRTTQQQPPAREPVSATPLFSASPPQSGGGFRESPPSETSGALALQPATENEQRDMAPVLSAFEDVVNLFSERREGILYGYLKNDVRLVSFEQGRIEINRVESATNDFAGRVGRCLSDWTGQRWVVVISSGQGAATLAEQEQQRKADNIEQARKDTLVSAIIEYFPGATITDVTHKGETK